MQLAAWFMLTLWVILVAIMGVVDGLKFRRVRLRYGAIILATIRGVPAQIIGGLSVLLALGGAALLIGYVDLLRHYCGANAGCFITTPIAGLFANWVVIGGNAIMLFCFILWARQRRAEVSPPTDRLSYSLPSVYRHVNGKLAVAHERAMNRPEVERIMEFVEQLGPFVLVTARKQVMDGKRVDPEKLAGVFLTDKRFRDQGMRARIAVEAVTEAYVVSLQPLKRFRNRR